MSRKGSNGLKYYWAKRKQAEELKVSPTVVVQNLQCQKLTLRSNLRLRLTQDVEVKNKKVETIFRKQNCLQQEEPRGTPHPNLRHQVCYATWFFAFTGVCPVSELALKYLLTQKGSGNAVVIVVGGAAEALLCQPGASTIYLKERKGFVKLALKTGWVPRFCTLLSGCHRYSVAPLQNGSLPWKPVKGGSLFTLIASLCSFTLCLNGVWASRYICRHFFYLKLEKEQ